MYKVTSLSMHDNDEGHDLLITVSFTRQATQEPSQDSTRDSEDEERKQGQEEVESWIFWRCWWRVLPRYHHHVSTVCVRLTYSRIVIIRANKSIAQGASKTRQIFDEVEPDTNSCMLETEPQKLLPSL